MSDDDGLMLAMRIVGRVLDTDLKQSEFGTPEMFRATDEVMSEVMTKAERVALCGWKQPLYLLEYGFRVGFLAGASRTAVVARNLAKQRD